MAFFGKKKEEIKEIPVSQPEPNVEVKEEESHFTSPEDLMKMTAEQINPSYGQPQPSVQSMPTVQLATRMPEVRIQHPQTNVNLEEVEKQTFAPLFVKLDRYKNILQALGEIKTTLSLMKNAFEMLDQIDKIEDENMNLIKSALDDVEQKLADLDADFLRPSGFKEKKTENQELENVQSVISTLHSQIEQLKGSMQQVQ